MKSHHQASLMNCMFATNQVVANVQSSHDEVVIRRNTHIIFEQVGNVVFRKMKLRCKYIKCKFLCVMSVYVIHNLVDRFVA